jgi:nucleoside 2-deoxyribosyltransferase
MKEMKMNKQPTVYLAGLISTDHPESLAWRTRAEATLIEAGFPVRSPMRGKEKLSEVSPDGGVTNPALTSSDIILRDYNDILSCDILLTHLSLFGSLRPMIGTLFELGWAWQMRKPVIGISPSSLELFEKQQFKLMRSHPFVTQAISHYFETEDEAVDFIINQWRR